MQKKRLWRGGILLLMILAMSGCGSRDRTARQPEPTKDPIDTGDYVQAEESIEAISRQAAGHTYSLERHIQGVKDAFATPGYWLKHDSSPYAIRMSQEEIKEYNKHTRDTKGLQLVDMTQPPEQISAKTVREMMEAYTFGKYQYLDGDILSENDRSYLLSYRNLGQLSGQESITVTYGIVISAADLRRFPSYATLMEKKSDWEFDYFQESELKVGEGVCVYHSSTDGKWLFVQAKNYAGWILADCIVPCSREEMVSYLTSDDFYIVTLPAHVQLDGTDVYLAMGCRLPSGENEQTASLPISENGVLAYRDLPVADFEHHKGYLPYTSALVLDQAMKLLNTPYGWGSKGNLLDCSATVLSVYDCFGFELPRNTSQMALCQDTRHDVSAMSNAEKKELLKQVLPGSLMIMKGHVMLYLGMDEDQVYVLHSFSKYYTKDGAKERVMQCTITPADIRKNGSATFLDAVHTVLEIQRNDMQEE